MSTDIAGQFTVQWTSNATSWPGRINMSRVEHDVWNFDFAVQGITEEEADVLADKVMLVLCGGGRFRHTRFGRWLLGCKRLVAGGQRLISSKGERANG